MNKYLSIAGFTIHLYSEKKILLDVGYKHFISPSVEKPDITVECKKLLNHDLPNGYDLVFSSHNEDMKFYDVYRDADDFLFVIYNQSNQSNQATIQQIAKLDADLKKWTIYSLEEHGAIKPLHYPMGPIMLHYAVLTADAVMMHASGVFDGTKGRMFSGFSGAGKSTISGIWKDSGCRMINDDRLIIRCEEGEYFIYNTPMFYEDENKRAPLDAIYLIRHFPENELKQISGAAAVTGIMAFSIQNNYDARFVAHHLEFFSKMADKVPIYRLGFVPDKAVIDFVREAEK